MFFCVPMTTAEFVHISQHGRVINGKLTVFLCGRSTRSRESFSGFRNRLSLYLMMSATAHGGRKLTRKELRREQNKGV